MRSTRTGSPEVLVLAPTSDISAWLLRSHFRSSMSMACPSWPIHLCLTARKWLEMTNSTVPGSVLHHLRCTKLGIQTVFMLLSKAQGSDLCCLAILHNIWPWGFPLVQWICSVAWMHKYYYYYNVLFLCTLFSVQSILNNVLAMSQLKITFISMKLSL